MPVQPATSPRLRIVTGKGGVGKTSVATAMALAAAQSGRRVLLAEAKGGDRVASLLGADPVGPEMREVRENLHVVDMSPRAAIREYALLVLRFETVYNAVFENRLVRYFIRLVPSLGELVMLGKLWFHEREEQDGRPRFDLIVLDAPATGHAISMFRTPAAVRRTVPPGPLRDNAQLIIELLSDPARSVMHIVTTPEEMPVNEAVELEQAASDLLQIKIGTTFINQRVPPLPEGVLEALAPLADHEEASAVWETLAIRQGKVEAGNEHLARLPAHMLDDSLSLPRITTGEQGEELLDQLVDELRPWVGGWQ